MSYFLTDQNLSINQIAQLAGEEVRHILLSRRMKVGERFSLQDSRFKRYDAEVVQARKGTLEVKILRQAQVPEEPAASIILYQSYVNEKALDFILQKSTELRANRIVLFNSQNTGVKLSRDQFEKKYDRWNKILWEAAKQCDRVVAPKLEYCVGLDEVLTDAKSLEKVFILDPAGKKTLNSEFSILNSLGLRIGPEGGFAPLELEQMRSLPNAEAVTLGPILLRAETAALAALSITRELCN